MLIEEHKHNPIFEREDSGYLRFKFEGREGTQVQEPDERFPTCTRQSFDSLSTDAACKTMSCSDKILRWNVLGVQGALLQQLIPVPIYLTSITIGMIISLSFALILYYSRTNTMVVEYSYLYSTLLLASWVRFSLLGSHALSSRMLPSRKDIHTAIGGRAQRPGRVWEVRQ